MPRSYPHVLRLPLRAVLTRCGLARYVAHTLRPRACELAEVVASYAFCNDERDFARAILERHTQLWVWRSRQSMACGDFVIVDVSSPDVARRHAYALELKQGRPVTHGAGGAGWQLRNVDAALDELIRRGVLGPEPVVTRLAGDGQRLYESFD